MDFSERTVIVTGSASGIGQATAEAFSEQGANVVIADIDVDEAEKAAESLLGEGDAIAVETDVRDESQVKRMVTTAVDSFGSVDVLINNAGVSQTVEPTVDQSTSEWEDVVDIHLKGTYLCSKYAGPFLLEDDGGAIVNMSSTTAFGAFPFRTAYGPAKAAIRNLTKVLAVEWANKGLRVNAVAPSYTRTYLVDDLIEKGEIDEESIKRRTPMERLADPRDVADAITFLASKNARYITGVTLPVDGGWTAYGHF